MRAIHLASCVVAVTACAGGGVNPGVAPAASASAPSARASTSAPVPPVASVVPTGAPSPADLRCDGRSCRVEKANEQTFGELARTRPDLGELEVLGGHPKTLAPLAPLRKLYRFKIALCEGLTDKDFGFAKDWQELTTLEVSNCDNFTSVAPLGALPRLNDLALINTSLRSLEFLQGSPLTALKVQSGVTDLSAIGALGNLRRLELIDLDAVHEAPFLAKLVHLERLTVDATDLVRLPDLSPLVALTELTLSHCPKLTEVKGLAALPTLTNLTLDWTGVVDLAALGRLDHVTFLHLEGTKVKDLVPLATWKNLGVVVVADDTPPALLAALKKVKPSLRAITAHQAALAAQGPR